VSEPELFTQRCVLDLDNSECDFHFWRHERYFELLCLGPTHMAKSWKKQISKLKLSADKEKYLLSMIWKFALETELCDCNELDAEWEALTRVALRLAGFEGCEDLVLLPHHNRLSTKTCFEVSHTDVRQVSHSERDDVLLANIMQCLDSIEIRVASLKSAGVSNHDEVLSLKAELNAVALKICQHGVELDSESTSSLTALSKVQRKIQKRMEKPAEAHTAVTPELVLKVMRHIYSLSHTWCQRLVCSGHTMQRKSSTWSEILNSSIKSYVKTRNMISGTYKISQFVTDVDQWVHELFEKSFIKNKIQHEKCSQILNPVHVSILEQVLCNAALNKLLDTLLPNTIQGEYAVSRSEVLKDSLRKTLKNRVAVFLKSFDILESEIKYFNVKPKNTFKWKSYGPKDRSGGCDLAVADDQVCHYLEIASKIANSNGGGSTLAVYFPSGEKCKISFFNQSRPSGYGVPFFCSCQQQSASGLPCEHMLAYILLPNHDIPQNRDIPRSVWNIIWLCHPAFLRGYMIPTGICPPEART
jgi:hypothetical protein